MTSPDEMEQVVTDMRDLLQQYAGGMYQTAVLSKDNVAFIV
jgi:hypothetical protein